MDTGNKGGEDLGRGRSLERGEWEISVILSTIKNIFKKVHDEKLKSQSTEWEKIFVNYLSIRPLYREYVKNT